MKLEPTYLRYIFDSLQKGSLNASNASALPQGFIGLFENEFPANISSFERTSLLKRLALWALFKGAVSAHFTSEILQEDVEDTKALIDTYSKWFNSPEPGKYILYHDRLRTYFLQKLSSHEIQSINEKLISFLEASLKRNYNDEANEYALQHLASHMAVESQLDNNYERLHEFVNQEGLWKKQLKVSKEYKWSQQGIQHAIKEGARRHNEVFTLISTVNSVKLMHEERNSTKQILDFITDGDYQTAISRLERIESNDKLKLSVLLIHDLTLGKFKDKPFKKEACLEILTLINKINDDNLNWTKYYPLSVMYFVHKELKKLNLNPETLWKKGNFDLTTLLDYNNSEEYKKLTKPELQKEIEEKKLLILDYKKRLNNLNENTGEYQSLNKEIEFQNLEIELAEKKILEGNFKMNNPFLLENLELNVIKEINFYNNDIYNKIDTYFLLLEKEFSKNIKDLDEKNPKSQIINKLINDEEVVNLISECLELVPKEIKLFIENIIQNDKKESRYVNYRLKLSHLLYLQLNRRNHINKKNDWLFLKSHENLSALLEDHSQLNLFDQLFYFKEIASQISEIIVYHNSIDLLSKANSLVKLANIHDNSITTAYTYLAYISLKLSDIEKAFEYTEFTIKELNRLVAKHKKILQLGTIKIDEGNYSFEELCAMDISKLEGKIDKNYAEKNIGNIARLYDLCIDLYVESLKKDNVNFSNNIRDFVTVVVKNYNDLILGGDKVKIYNNLIFEKKLNDKVNKLVSEGFIKIAKSVYSSFQKKEIILNDATSNLSNKSKIENFNFIFNHLVSFIYDESFNDITFNFLLDEVKNNELFDSSKKYRIISFLIEQKYFENAIELSKIVDDKNIQNDSLNLALESLSLDSSISSLNISLLVYHLQKSCNFFENTFRKCISILNLVKNENDKKIVNEIILDLINKKRSINDTIDAIEIIQNQPTTFFNKEHYLDLLRNKLVTQINQISTLDILKKLKNYLGEDIFRLNKNKFQKLADNLLIEEIIPINYKSQYESIIKSLEDYEFYDSLFNNLDEIYLLCLDFECYDIAGYCYTVIMESFPMIFNIYESLLCNKIIMTNSFDRKFEIEFDMIEYSESVGELIPKLRDLGFDVEANELKYIISDYDNVFNGGDELNFELAIYYAKNGFLDSALSRLKNTELDNIKDLSFYYLFKVLISQNNITAILTSIDNIKHNYFKSLILFEICVHYYNSGDNDKHNEFLQSSIKLVSSLTSQWRRDSIFLKIWNFYYELDKIEQAEFFHKKIVFDAYKLSVEFICIKENLIIEGKDSRLYLEFKEKLESIELHFDTNLFFKLENIYSELENNILSDEELDDLISTLEDFPSDLTITIREQIRLCKSKKLYEKLLFIQKKLEPYRFEYDLYIQGENYLILLIELYDALGNSKKLHRILQRI